MSDQILKRRPNSGFVAYPLHFEKRMVDGTARYRTRCDMLVGPCACGHVHQEDDEFVHDLLQYYGVTIETLNLTVKDGKVYIPRYWIKAVNHENCDVLSGPCKCGNTHKANEWWVVELLAAHGAKILNCSETELPVVDKPTDQEKALNSVRWRRLHPRRNEI